mmetsp:Transcript_10367/g.34023  ORF Transcript_10367/g.34023 Transcript_10367/m.34023 type:complete len:233 (-) Transcript_10367:1018-1716(-)
MVLPSSAQPRAASAVDPSLFESLHLALVHARELLTLFKKGFRPQEPRQHQWWLASPHSARLVGARGRRWRLSSNFTLAHEAPEHLLKVFFAHPALKHAHHGCSFPPHQLTHLWRKALMHAPHGAGSAPPRKRRERALIRPPHCLALALAPERSLVLPEQRLRVLVDEQTREPFDEPPVLGGPLREDVHAEPLPRERRGSREVHVKNVAEHATVREELLANKVEPRREPAPER